MVISAYADQMKDIIVTTPAGFGVLMILSSFTIYALFGDMIQHKFRILFHKLDGIAK